jgi:hypothetical protein
MRQVEKLLLIKSKTLKPFLMKPTPSLQPPKITELDLKLILLRREESKRQPPKNLPPLKKPRPRKKWSNRPLHSLNSKLSTTHSRVDMMHS